VARDRWPVLISRNQNHTHEKEVLNIDDGKQHYY